MAEALRNAGGRAVVDSESPPPGAVGASQGMILGVPMAWAPMQNPPRRYAELANLSQGLPSDRLESSLTLRRIDGIVNLVGARWLISAPKTAVPPPGWRPTTVGVDASVFENTEAMPRTWIAPHERVLPSWESIALALSAGSFDTSESAILEGTAPAPPDMLLAPSPAEPAFARIVQDGLQRVEVEFSAPNGGFVVLADRWDSGWRARLDGRPIPVLRAFGVLRAVRVPPGSGRVSFVYRPRSVAAGGLISLAMAVGLAAWAGWRRRRARFAQPVR